MSAEEPNQEINAEGQIREDINSYEPKYLSTCAEFPPTRDPGYPRIIDVNRFSEDMNFSDLRAADGIATALYMYKPETLHRFFDISRRSATFIIGQSLSAGTAAYASTSGAGSYEDNGSFIFRDHLGQVDWDIRVQYRISESGKWIPIEGVDCMRHRTRDSEEVEELGISLAQTLVFHRAWETIPGHKVTASK